MNGGQFVKTRLQCPWGELLKAEDENELVEKAFAHLNDKHPELVDAYEREHILFMAH
jgi:predicted small metal-binding protein